MSPFAVDVVAIVVGVVDPKVRLTHENKGIGSIALDLDLVIAN